MAWPIRQLKRGKRGRIDPTRAVRTAMLSQASAYAGALLGGMYGGFALVLLRDWSHAPRREAAIAAGLAALGGLIMLVAGVVAVWWCRIPDGGEDETAHEARSPGVAH
jgi:predicted NAD/FAD-binding protein